MILLDKKHPTEVWSVTVRFANYLGEDEIISAATASATADIYGTDPSPNDVLADLTPDFDDTTVTLELRGGLDEVDYLILVTITTDGGHTFVEFLRLPVRNRK
jgi:hypothetical protein